MRWLVSFYKIRPVSPMMSQDVALSSFFKHPASKQYYAPYTREWKKYPIHKPTLWVLLWSSMSHWRGEFYRGGMVLYTWRIAILWRKRVESIIMTHFWVLAGFSAFSLYGMTRSPADSGFWRRIPNLILISLALKEEMYEGKWTSYEHKDIKKRFHSVSKKQKWAKPHFTVLAERILM